MIGRSLLAAGILLAATAPGVLAHEGDPNYSSTITRVTPQVDGLDLRVVNYDDSLELRNRTGETVVVEGYNDEPYARIGADGLVEVNRRSPATYLNSERGGEVPVPDSADPKLPPQWDQVATDGRFAWHDHRIHYMGRGRPSQVTDESKRTRIVDWSVPIAVGADRGTVDGTLDWVGKDDGTSAGLLVGLGLAVLVAIGGSVAVLRRRLRTRNLKETW